MCGGKKQAILEAAKFLAENRIHSIQIEACVVYYSFTLHDFDFQSKNATNEILCEYGYNMLL